MYVVSLLVCTTAAWMDQRVVFREYNTLHWNTAFLLSLCSTISRTLAAAVDLPVRHSEHCASALVRSLP